MNLDVVSRLVKTPVKGVIISSGSTIMDIIKPYVKHNLDYCEDKPDLDVIKQGCESLLNDRFVPEDYPYSIADIINPNFAEQVDKNNMSLDINAINIDYEFETKLRILEGPEVVNIRDIITSCRRFETKIALILSTLTEETLESFISDASVDSELVYTCMAISRPGFIRQPNPHIGNYNLFITNGVDTVAIKINSDSIFNTNISPKYFGQLRKVCNVCLNKSNKVCVCKKVRYCSPECQHIHRQMHKRYCLI